MSKAEEPPAAAPPADEAASPLKEKDNKTADMEKSNTDVSAGPIKDRGCTDVWCLVVFLVHWLGFALVVLVGMQDGNPRKLYSPRDFKGDFCGVTDNWNGGTNMEAFKSLYYMMNLTEMVAPSAMQFICSTAVEEVVRDILEPLPLSTYMCSCCKSPCASCVGVLGSKNFGTIDEAGLKTSAKMADLTDSSRVSNLMSPSGANAGEFNNVFAKAAQYFVQVCATTCGDATYGADPSKPSPADMRTYVYSPAPDAFWRNTWEKLRTNTRTTASHVAVKNTLVSSFTFKALPKSLCPYEGKYCVPFPGVSFTELAGGYCTFAVSAAALSAMGKTADMMNVDTASAKGAETIGSAMGDVMDSLDTLVVVCFLAFVIGFVFLILLRFFISIVVYGAIFCVFVGFMGAGAAAYVRSGQCAGTSMSDTGKSYGYAAASYATESLNGTQVTSDESISGNGQAYRGVQQVTKGVRTCQNWNATSPQPSILISPSSSPAGQLYAQTNGLINNYCRNPEGGAQYIYCYTTDPSVRWEYCDPIGVYPWDHNCPTGFVIESEDRRTYTMYFAIVLWVFGALWWLIVAVLWKRIRLAVALNKVAAHFLYNTPQVIFVPIVQALCAMLWTVFWAFCASFILSQVTKGYVPTDSYKSYAIAYGTETVPGMCTGSFPTGYVWKDEGDLTANGDPCSGDMGNTSSIVGGPACWKCSPPRYMFDIRFWYAFFTYLWNNMFIIGTGQTAIAGACGVWFFAPHGTKSKVSSVGIGVRNTWRFHAGSIALGAAIIAAVQLARFVCMYIEKQAAAAKNKVMVVIMKILGCLLWVFEKCLKFITKNAYIQIALVGKNFCVSGKKAFQLITRNFVRFGVFALLGGMVNMLGIMMIVLTTSFIGYYFLTSMHPDISAVVPVMIYMSVSYVVAKLFMMVFHLACDTMMQCFIITEEMGLEEAGEFVPGELRRLIPSTE